VVSDYHQTMPLLLMHAHERVHIGAFDRVMLLSIREQILLEDVQTLKAMGDLHNSRHPRHASITLNGASVKLPDGPTRKALGGLLKDKDAQIVSGAIVLPSNRFIVASVRMLLTGMNVLAGRGDRPQHVVGTVDEAARITASSLGESEAWCSELIAATQALQAAHASFVSQDRSRGQT
jgi:hypothetical protein